VQCGCGFEGDILIFVFSKVWFRKSGVLLLLNRTEATVKCLFELIEMQITGKCSLPRARVAGQKVRPATAKNFCRIHKTLRVTPAMEAKLTTKPMTKEDIVNLLEVYK